MTNTKSDLDPDELDYSSLYKKPARFDRAGFLYSPVLVSTGSAGIVYLKAGITSLVNSSIERMTCS